MWVFGVHQPEKYLISDFWKEGEQGEGKRFEEEKKLVIQVRIYLHWPWPNSFHRDDTRHDESYPAGIVMLNNSFSKG